MIHSKQTCADCHFFVKQCRSPPDLTLLVSDVSKEERHKAKVNDFSWVQAYNRLACHFGVWDEGFKFDPQNRNLVIAQTERHDFCFFWQYKVGMLIPAAVELQKRESETRELSRDRRLTLCGLWIAAIALVVNVLLTIANGLKIWPFIKQ